MKFSLIIVSIFFALNSIAQYVVVQPYLQNLTEQSVVVMKAPLFPLFRRHTA